MPCRVSLTQLIDLLAATPLQGDRTLPKFLPAADAIVATGITTDTRQLQTGEVFLALRGEQFDGHAFVTQAAAKGAVAAIVEMPVPEVSLPLLQVPNTLLAYQTIARWWRNQFTIPVIAVTGSVGKTTTKELIAAVLSRHGQVLKSQANYNNEIGVPKTLLELDASHDYAVIEMGMRAAGEIACLGQIARPDIGVITNVGTAHIGRLGSEDAIAQAKCELLAELPAIGTAILNHDNARLMQTAATVWPGKIMTFGLEGGDLHGELLDAETLKLGDLTLPLPLPGRHNALNYLAAIAVAQVIGCDWSDLVNGLSVNLPGGRARRYELPQDMLLLDETYNAGLESMLAALHLLAQTPGTRRIAVLGTMKELGDRSPEFHHQVGQAVRDLALDKLLILADPTEAEAMATGAAPLTAERYASHAAVVDRLQELLQPGDRVLFKASRAVGLDQVVEQVRATLTPIPA
jgi:UDP-N-acetylmuramoyl-tripeptide--D-alanyl-D-alanine ligase